MVLAEAEAAMGLMEEVEGQVLDPEGVRHMSWELVVRELQDKAVEESY